MVTALALALLVHPIAPAAKPLTFQNAVPQDALKL